MVEEKVKVSNIEWKMDIPEGSIEFKPSVQKRSLHNIVFEKIRHVLGGWHSSFNSICRMAWRLGADDPRRIFHSIKVGIALVLVSLFYFMHPLFETVTWGMTVWSIMTVVVVFEFTAGATLYKGLNRMFATLMGGLLAVGTDYVADQVGGNGEPIILGTGVFLVGTASTFARFFPKVKATYEYGVLIFTLSFSFMTISGYRVDNLFEVAYQRLGTIIIGSILCILTSLLICPIWAGEDLHRLITHNLEGLAGSLEGCVREYFRESTVEHSHNDNVSQGYKCLLNSKASEESLANFAAWEPPHGRFGFRYPWKQYVKIGVTMRYCAYCVEALNGCLNTEIQAPYSLRERLKTPCMNLAAESSNVLLELANGIKTMTRSARIDLITDRLNTVVEELQICLVFERELFVHSNRWEIVEETPRHKIVNFKVTPPSESKRPQDLRIDTAEGRMGTEANIKQTISRERKICPCEDLPVTTDDSAAARANELENYETVEGVAFMDTAPLATVACLLTEIVARLGTVIMAVDELGERANFTRSVDDQPTIALRAVDPVHVKD